MKGDIDLDALRDRYEYNPETGHFFHTKPRPGIVVGRIAGGICGRGYRRIRFQKTVYAAHRLAWFYMYGVWPDREVDHIDGNRDNNALANLRLVTKSQNMWNSKIRKNNRSGFKGVCLQRGRWVAQICHNKKKIIIGRFKTPDEAAEAYRAKSIEFHGEFARPT